MRIYSGEKLKYVDKLKINNALKDMDGDLFGVIMHFSSLFGYVPIFILKGMV